MKQAKVLSPECTSLLLGSKPIQRNYLHFFKNFKTMRSLKVNEIELILRTAFNLDHFALGGEKESKYDKKNPFLGAPCSKLTCLLTLTFRNMLNGCFQTFLVLGIFWQTDRSSFCREPQKGTLDQISQLLTLIWVRGGGG